jgi:hypothetical protein
MRLINGLEPLPPYTAADHGDPTGPDPAASPAPQTPPSPQRTPAAPFPGEPGDVPADAPMTNPARDPGPVPGDPGPGAPAPDEQQAPYGKPMPERAAVAEEARGSLSQMSDTLCNQIDNVIATYQRVDRQNLRLDLALTASMLGFTSTLNFMHSAISKLEPEDWRTNLDLAITLRRQCSELTALLDPICAERKPRLVVKAVR